MEESSPIDKIRKSGGSADIGNDSDGAIKDMIGIDGLLYIIKEKSIYEFMMADYIDPQRTNINLPTNMQRLIINQGYNSELVGRTLLTAKTLFKTDLFDENTVNKVLKLSIELIQELSILEKEINEYLHEEVKANGEYEERKNMKVSYAIPSIINLDTGCKTIFQKADHIEQILMEIISSFYPKEGLTKQSHFPKLHQILTNKYGEKDSFTDFISKTINYMKIIRDLRNGLDHRLDSVKISNYELQSNSDILSPTIELKSKDIKLERIALSHFLPIVKENMITIIESTFVYLAQKNIQDNTLFYQIKEIPEKIRRNKYVRYCFWMPLRKEGYYTQ